MQLVERYVQAVEFWLPEKQKRDIAAELSEDIETQIREMEGRLGRALLEAEVEDLLRRIGRPGLERIAICRRSS